MNKYYIIGLIFFIVLSFVLIAYKIWYRPSTGKSKPDDVNGGIGVNLGSWLNMETWMFDFPPFKPQSNDTGVSDFGNTVPNMTNYQRGELGTIREVNGDSGVFDENIPPSDRSDAPAGKIFMKNWWKTWLSSGDNQAIKNIQQSKNPVPDDMFSIFKNKILTNKMNFHRVPIGYWTFSDWNNVKERGFKESKNVNEVEPELWYNNEGFVVGGKKYLTQLLNFIKTDPELQKENIKFILDLHALPGVQTANSDFTGWNTGVQNSMPTPPNKLFSGGTWQTDQSQYPIQNDSKRNGINWVYPGPLPGSVDGITAFSGYTNWVEHSIEIIKRITNFVKDNNFEDLIYGIEAANEPASDNGRVVISWEGSSGTPIDNNYLNVIVNYLKSCYQYLNSTLPDQKFIISVISNSFYGNGEDVTNLINTVKNNTKSIDQSNIIIDTHRYLNWGFIPDFQTADAQTSINAITNGQNSYDVPNTLSYKASWKKYKTIQGEWSIAIDNNNKIPTESEAASLFGSQVRLIKSQPNLVAGCYWMLRAGYGLYYTDNLIQYKPGRAWNNSGDTPGDPWQHKDWIWSYANLMLKYPNLWSASLLGASVSPGSPVSRAVSPGSPVSRVVSPGSQVSRVSPIPVSGITTCYLNADSKGFEGADNTGTMVPNGNISLEACGNKCKEESSCTYYKSGPGQWCELYQGTKFASDSKWNSFVSQVNNGKFGKFNGGDGTKYYTGISPTRCT